MSKPRKSIREVHLETLSIAQDIVRAVEANNRKAAHAKFEILHDVWRAKVGLSPVTRIKSCVDGACICLTNAQILANSRLAGGGFLTRPVDEPTTMPSETAVGD